MIAEHFVEQFQMSLFHYFILLLFDDWVLSNPQECLKPLLFYSNLNHFEYSKMSKITLKMQVQNMNVILDCKIYRSA